MTSLPSMNRKISIISLVTLGIAALVIILYNIDKLFAGGMAVKRIAETCDILGSGCSSAFTSIFHIVGSPGHLLLGISITALIMAATKALMIIISARRIAARYNQTVQAFPRVYMIIKNLKAENVRVKIAGDNGISAFTYGVLRPTICLSKGLIDSLSEDELTALIAHEVGHIKRHDNLAIFLGLFVRDFLWPLPISHYLFSIFINEKEYAADDFAVQLTGKPLDLAGAIVSVAKAVRNTRVLSPAYATFFPNKASVKARVGRLVGSHDRVRPSLLKLLSSVTLSLIIAASIISFAYAQPFSKNGASAKCQMGEDCKKQNYECCELK